LIVSSGWITEITRISHLSTLHEFTITTPINPVTGNTALREDRCTIHQIRRRLWKTCIGQLSGDSSRWGNRSDDLRLACQPGAPNQYHQKTSNKYES
jgi:hypothetical protein